jgi:diguanylate cyclase (GGDEF)-like protein
MELRSHFSGLAGRLFLLNLVRLAVAVIGVAIMGFAVLELRSAAHWVDHSDRVLAQSDVIERSTIDLETGARGYLLTAGVRFLEPTRVAQAQLPGELARLRQLVSDDNAQERRATALAAAVSAYQSSWLAPTLFPGPSGPTQLRLALSNGKQKMDALRSRFATFNAVETALRSRREAHARLVEKVVAALAAAAVAGLLISALLSARWTRRRVVDPLLQLRHAIEEFDATEHDRTRAAQDGFAEVGDLARAFNEMSDELSQSRDQAQVLTAELALQARTDFLTGLANRRQFELELARACASARRYQTPLSLLSLDVDRFKTINDTHGHAAGDSALQIVAAICRANTRASDLIARVGGDEFAILMPQTARHGANTVAASIQQALISHPPNAQIGSLTVSVGVAAASGDAQADELAGAADAEMYNNKRLSQESRRNDAARVS